MRLKSRLECKRELMYDFCISSRNLCVLSPSLQGGELSLRKSEDVDSGLNTPTYPSVFALFCRWHKFSE